MTVRQRRFSGQDRFTYSCLLAEELQNGDNDEIVLLEDGQVDVGDLARTAFILGMDTKTLCSEDCKDCAPVRCRPEPRPLLLQKETRSRVWRSWQSFLENRENE